MFEFQDKRGLLTLGWVSSLSSPFLRPNRIRERERDLLCLSLELTSLGLYSFRSTPILLNLVSCLPSMYVLHPILYYAEVFSLFLVSLTFLSFLSPPPPFSLLSPLVPTPPTLPLPSSYAPSASLLPLAFAPFGRSAPHPLSLPMHAPRSHRRRLCSSRHSRLGNLSSHRSSRSESDHGM